MVSKVLIKFTILFKYIVGQALYQITILFDFGVFWRQIEPEYGDTFDDEFVKPNPHFKITDKYKEIGTAF